ncbi:MAG: glycosyltransferase [Clostridia bacterium]|nr:glycosyltransferase [Clostridia bacterium]
MRVLILTCNTGEGHNSAARALKEAFDKADIYCEIADSLSFLSPKASNFISKWHVRLYKKAPVLFGLGYKAAEITDKSERSMLYEIMSKGAHKLNKKLSECRCDTIICTHPFSAMTLTRTIKKFKPDVRSYFVATDYTCSPGVSASRLDYYIIPHETLCGEFERHGISPEKLFSGGIPVTEKIVSGKTPAESKTDLLIPPEKRVILLMCGSMGCGPIKLIARKLSATIKDNEQLVVICGNNKKLYQSLKILDDPGRVRILGFTRNVPDYMNAAELFVTKPGGLSTTEAAERHLPMVLINAVSGCETYNLNFWVKNNMALTSDSADGICSSVRMLMGNEDERKKLRDTLAKNFSCSSSKRIYEFIAQR